jgi:2-polyprenyl-3-methyl-5-hydroxy-6-metoxy-1,4-benzoquinol methylase
MSEINFDNYSDDYNEVLAKSIGFVPGNDRDFFDNFKINCIEALFSVKSQYSILDFGCGIGNLSVLLAKKFTGSKIYGYDVSDKSLLIAQKRNENIQNLFFINDISADQKYDIILGANVFHHVKKNERSSTLKKLMGLLQSGGAIVIIEHNPYNPLTRYIVKRCPFDADAKLISRQEFIKLACGCGLSVNSRKYVLMFPWDFKIFRIMEKLFSQIPFGAQYMLLLAKRPE